MGKPSLYGVDLKLRRADQHLALLKEAEARFLAKPRLARLDHEPATGDYVLRYLDEQPRPEWGLSVSEFVHMLRTALDNLLYQLVELRGGSPGRHTQFPIYDDEPHPPRKPKGGRACAPKRDPWNGIKGVFPPDAAFIKAAQPYKLGTDRNIKLSRWHPLSMLGYLNNVDKHRTIHPSVTAAGFVLSPLGPGFTAGRVPIFLRDDDRFVPLFTGKIPVRDITLDIGGGETLTIPTSFQGASIGGWYVVGVTIDGTPVQSHGRRFTDDRTELMRLTGIPETNGKVEMNPPPSLVISFSDIERPMSLYDLEEIRLTVREIVDHFRPEFV